MSRLSDPFRSEIFASSEINALDVHLFTHRPPDASDATVEAYVRPMVEKAALALSTNEAWALLAIVTPIGLLLVPLAGKPPQSQGGRPDHF